MLFRSFSSWWSEELRRANLPTASMTYRICQDLEARLGIAQGKVAPPDYRDYLADLIEERYGSRYRFCKETGIDPGHLSRVFASRSELSLQRLNHILEALHATLVIKPEGGAVEAACRIPRNSAAALSEFSVAAEGGRCCGPGFDRLAAESGMRLRGCRFRIVCSAMLRPGSASSRSSDAALRAGS